MSTSELGELQDVMSKVRAWSPEMRLMLAEQLLRSLYLAVRPAGLRGVPVEQVLGVAAGAATPPDGETMERWLEEHRAEKYGP